MLRTLGIWVVAVAAIAGVALQLEEREDRSILMDEQRYQSCMTQEIGSATNLLFLQASVPSERVVRSDRSVRLDEAITRCHRAFPHATAPTTAKK